MDKEIVISAAAGNKEAIDIVLRENSDLIFNLCLRMLGDIDDAKDASQEIYIRIIENVKNFRMESEISTWIYRISVNYLLRFREKRSKFENFNFEIYEADLIAEHFDVSYPQTSSAEDELAKELKYSCSNVMLQCLDARSRCIFVLSTMFHIDAKTGSQIMEISYDNYRQILSRSKKRMQQFLSGYCMMNGNCDCKRRIGHAMRTQRLNPDKLEYSTLKVLDSNRIAIHTSTMELLDDKSDFFHELPYYKAKEELLNIVEIIKTL